MRTIPLYTANPKFSVYNKNNRCVSEVTTNSLRSSITQLCHFVQDGIDLKIFFSELLRLMILHNTSSEYSPASLSQTTSLHSL